MLSHLFARRAIASADHQGFRRQIGGGALVALGVGGIIGTGIFILTGTAAALHAGPAVVLSFIVAAFACTLAAMCYAELASALPVSGSAYSYTYASLGELPAWFVAWNLILEYLLGASLVAVGWSGYLLSALADLGIVVPSALAQTPLVHDASGWRASGALINLPAVAVIALMGVFAYTGLRNSARANAVFLAIKLTVIVGFIGFGAAYVDPALWHPFVPSNTGTPGEFGFSGVMQGAAMVFFTYLGFDALATLAQEVRDPQRNVPLGIFGALLACTLLYVAVALVLTGLVSYRELDVAAPVALAMDRTPALAWLAPWVKWGAIAGMTSVLLVILTALPRIFHAVASDGLLPRVLSRLHPRFATPHRLVLICTLTAMAMAGLLPLHVLGELISLGTLSAFAVVCVAVPVLRRTRPDLTRHFRVPAANVVAPLGVLVCLYLMSSVSSAGWWRFGVWSVLGVALYAVYGYRRSPLRVG
jgi:APA family basic amino acid/polyamine antiporter